MIETILEYKETRDLTWSQVAADFGSDHYQEAQQWKNQGWVVVTEDNGACRLMSPRRTLQRNPRQRTLRNNPRA